jgi:DNA polymerase III gamma/tau subunit
MTLREIIGHRRLTMLIARAIDRESLPPTLLFAGPPGVGKWAVARATAQAVNCLEPLKSTGDLAIDACGKCDRAIASRAACTSTSLPSSRTRRRRSRSM